MNTDHVAHALVDSYVFQKAIAHGDYEAMAREIAVMLAAAEAAAYERAAEWAEQTTREPMDYIGWSPGPAADDRALHIAAAIRTLALLK